MARGPAPTLIGVSAWPLARSTGVTVYDGVSKNPKSAT